MKNNLTLAKLFNDLEKSNFSIVLEKFFLRKFSLLTDEDLIKINSIAIVLLNLEDFNLRKLGYHLTLKYSIVTENYEAIFDVSKNLLNIPILNLLFKNNFSKNMYLDELDKMIIDSGKIKRKNGKNIYYTLQQINMRKNFLISQEDMAIIAPTSFGKTDLIMDFVLNNYKDKNICIVVPTKALINQTRTDLIRLFASDSNAPRIITHHDIKPSPGKRNVFILTQERLHRLIFEIKTPIVFDVLLIDEAHNIFENDSRAKLLSKLIIYLKNKNKNFRVKYFSPIVDKSENLLPKFASDNLILENKATPFIKSEDFYYVECKEDSKFIKYFNPYFNCWYNVDTHVNGKYDFIISNAGTKNIIYINSPRKAILAAHSICEKLSDIISPKIQKMINTISSFVSADYDLIDFVRKGVIYHCGIIPDNIRIYIEKCVKEIDELKYVFCTSTLLEGVNMPFNKMFILDIWKGESHLSYHQLQNLIGRVNRFNLIFNEEQFNIQSLISEVYFLKDDSTNKNDNYMNFISNGLKLESNSVSRNDPVENPYLEKSNSFLSDNEKSLIANLLEQNIFNEPVRQIKTNVGMLMIEQDMVDCNIFDCEELIQQRVDTWCTNNDCSILDTIYKIFIEDIDYEEGSKILDLNKEGARNYYAQFIKWRRENLSFAQMISRVIYFWGNHLKQDYIFVGRKWGDTLVIDGEERRGYIDKKAKSNKQLTNYAIIKIKEDLDYFDFYIFRYIEILHKLNILDSDTYKLIRYGTINDIQIYFINEGMSSELSKLLTEQKYQKYIQRTIEGGYVINKQILESLIMENDILLVELKYYLEMS